MKQLDEEARFARLRRLCNERDIPWWKKRTYLDLLRWQWITLVVLTAFPYVLLYTVM